MMTIFHITMLMCKKRRRNLKSLRGIFNIWAKTFAFSKQILSVNIILSWLRRIHSSNAFSNSGYQTVLCLFAESRPTMSSIFHLSMRLGWMTRLYDCFIHSARLTLLVFEFIFLYVINATFCSLLRVHAKDIAISDIKTRKFYYKRSNHMMCI